MLKTALVFLVIALAAFAQNSGVQGQVTDSSGAVVPNAAVTLTNLETGVALRYATNEQGLYIAPSLNPGRYKIEAAASGNGGVGTPNAGRIIQAEDPRRIQFALKYLF
jgi:protocatechuate 3,4-dioxygenase beta subunit